MGVITSFIWAMLVMMFVMSIVRKAAAKGSPQGQQKPPQQQGQVLPQQAKRQAARTVTDAERARPDGYRSRQAQPDIVERAKANSRRYAARDETLAEMESAHGHSERVGSAVAGYVESEREAHRRMHEEPHPPVEEESCLGTIEDLMVKGYHGNLSFERDFIGEAQDFLASITMPG